MSTDNKQQNNYTEPLGFEGIKGKWELSVTRNDITYLIRMKDEEGQIPIARSLNKYDAKLIAQSKELAKALQSLVNHYLKGGTNQQLDELIKASKETLTKSGLKY